MRNRRRVAPPPSIHTSPQRNRGVVLDWRAYFYEFCSVHGEPVKYKDSLLFRDGWRYSATSYEGPEYPPPKKHTELDALVLEYWKIRKEALTVLVLKLQHQRKTIEEIQASRSLPLQQTTQVDDGDKRHKSYKPLDISMLINRIEWIQDDLRECDTRLKEIEKYYKKGKNK